MSSFKLFGFVFFFVLLGCLAFGNCSEDEQSRVLVKFKKNVHPGKRSEIHPRGTTFVRHISKLGVDIVKSVNPEVLDYYNTHPDVEWAEFDFKGEGGLDVNDPRTGEQWALNTLEASNVWDITLGKSSVKVAVLDSGIQFNHPDFAQTTVLSGKDYVNNDNDPTDDHGHGTHVSGIIAASINNGVGIAGFANVTILPLKVLDSQNRGFYSDWADAMIDAADQGIPIISMSLQGTGASSTLKSAADYAWNKGSLIVACAGNFQLNPRLPSQLGTYASTLAVMNLQQDGTRNPTSNIGSYVDVGAPGTSILSTYVGSSYASLSGCSMATPYVSAYAALLLSVNPNLTNQELKDIIINNVVDLGPAGKDDEFGHGRIDPVRGLNSAISKSPASDSIALLKSARILLLVSLLLCFCFF